MAEDFLTQAVPRRQSLEAEARKSLNAIAPPTKYPSTVAADRALQESLATNDAGSFEIFAQQNLESNVVSEGLIAVHSELASSQLQQSFASEVMGATSEEERIAIAGKYSKEINKQTADVRSLAYMRFLTDIPVENQSLDSFDMYSYMLTPDDVRQMRHELSEEGKDELLSVMYKVPASLAHDSMTETAAEISKLILIPLQDVMTESIAFDPEMGIDFRYFRTGKFRQDLRNHLATLSESQLIEVVTNLSNAFEKAQSDPILGTLLSDFSIVDFWMGVLNEDVLINRQPGGKGTTTDSVLSTVSTALDYLYIAGVVGRVAGLGRPLAAALSNGMQREAGRVAAKVGGARASQVLDMLRNDANMTSKFNIDTNAAKLSQLPKPAGFTEGIKNVPEPLVKAVAEAQERIARLNDISAKVSRNYLTEPQKFSLIKEEAMKIADIATPINRPGLSELSLLENDAGWRIKTVLGASEQSGWKRIADVMRTAKQLDPDGVLYTISRVSSDGKLVPVFTTKEAQRLAVSNIKDATINTPFTPTAYNNSNEYFITYAKDRFYHPTDKVSFGTNPVLRSGGVLLNKLVLNPRARFSRETAGTAGRLYGLDQELVRRTEALFKPYYDLSIADKRQVGHIADWAEEFGALRSRNPNYTEALSQFPDATEAAWKGHIALREGWDAWYGVYNTRQHQLWNAKNFRTARSDTLPTFHGKSLSPEEAAKEAVGANKVYNPLDQSSTSFTSKQLEDFYSTGGRIMELDLHVDVPNKAGIRHTLVKIDPNDGYAIEALDPRPLKYTPGYRPRFYDDPYIIQKVYNQLTINGKLKKSEQNMVNSEFKTSIRTVASKSEGEDLVANINSRLMSRLKKGETARYEYKLVYGQDLSIQEKSASIQEVLKRQGRLFWDERDAVRMKDLNGNPAPLMDEIKSLEQATHIMARQTASEDFMTSFRNAFKNDYSDVLNPRIFDNMNSKQVRDYITGAMGAPEAAKTAVAKRLKEARDLWDYMRTLDGVNSDLFAETRKFALNKAAGLSKYLSPSAQKAITKEVGKISPIQAARSATFMAYIGFRPGRQLLLQGLQFLFVSPLDPFYVLSGKIFSDNLAITAGLIKKGFGMSTGVPDSTLAKIMGITTGEYDTLVKRLDESGRLSVVDVHSISGGTRRASKVALPQSQLGKVGYGTKKGLVAVRDFMQRYGFDVGERANQKFTFLISVRKYLKEKGLSKPGKRFAGVNKLNDKEWDEILENTQSLSMGMDRTDQFIYQNGPLALTTQFMSFSHKALLSMMNANPALSTKDTLKIVGGMYLLYGTDIFGARDVVEKWLNNTGFRNLSQRAKDLLSGGFIDRIFNDVGQEMVDDWKDIDISGNFAPGPNLQRYAEDWLEGVFEDPTSDFLLKLTGPAGNLGSKLLQGVGYAAALRNGRPDMTAKEKFLQGADMILKGALPQYKGVADSYFAWKMDEWYTAAGQGTDLRPTMNTLIARGLFGVYSRESIDYWATRSASIEWEKELDAIVRADKQFLTIQLNLYGAGELTYEGLLDRTIYIANRLEDIPEDMRIKYIERINEPTAEYESLIAQFTKIMLQGIQQPDLIERMSKFEQIPEEEANALREIETMFNQQVDAANEYYQTEFNKQAEDIIEDRALKVTIRKGKGE